MGKARDDSEEAVAGAVSERALDLIINFLMDHHQQQVFEGELTILQAEMLRLLRQGPIRTGDLAEGLRITAPAATQLTDRMERKQLIQRVSSDGDRRCVLIRLTEKGVAAIARLARRRNDTFRAALSELEERERASVLLALSRFVTILERQEPRTAVRPSRASNPVGPVETEMT